MFVLIGKGFVPCCLFGCVVSVLCYLFLCVVHCCLLASCICFVHYGLMFSFACCPYMVALLFLWHVCHHLGLVFVARRLMLEIVVLVVVVCGFLLLLVVVVVVVLAVAFVVAFAVGCDFTCCFCFCFCCCCCCWWWWCSHGWCGVSRRCYCDRCGRYCHCCHSNDVDHQI